jgi:O-antigen/teichoic acid export membrane protein
MKSSSSTVKTIIVTAGRSVERIVLLGSTILLSRYLSQHDYGTYRQVFLITGILITILNFGIPNSINYFLPQYDKKKQKSFLIQTVLFQLFLGVLATLFLWLTAGLIGNKLENPELVIALKMFALYPLFILPSMAYSNIFICINKVKLAGILSPVLGLIKLLVIVICVLLGYPLTTLLIFILISSFIQFSIIVFILWKTYHKISFSVSFSNLMNQLKFSAPIGFATILGMMIVKIDQLMVSYYFSVEEYAVFSVGAIEIPFINMITIAAMAVITPYLVSKYKSNEMDQFLRKWRNSVLKLSFVIFPVALFFIFFGRDVIILLYSDKYVESSIIFRIYQLKLLTKVTFFGHVLLALGKPKKILIFSFITLIVNILLNFLFINLFGFIGAACATIISAFLISFLQLSEIARIVKIKFINIWPWSKLALIFGISLITAYSTSALAIFIKNRIVLLGAEVVLFTIIYYLLTQVILKRFVPKNLHLKSMLRS